MATPKLLEISRDLSYKLQDPTSSGSTDGKRFTAYHRLRYIIRGYRRLIRLIEELSPEQVNILFTDYYKVSSYTTSSVGILGLSSNSIREPLEIFVRWQSSAEEWIRAEYIEPTNYLSVETGQNSFYKPDLNNSLIYWTIIGDNIVIVPEVQYTAKIFYMGELPTFEYNGSTDIDLPEEYLDLILSLAASEAYLDLGEGDLSRAFKLDAAEQVQALVAVKKEREVKENESNI